MSILIPECSTNTIRLQEMQEISSSFPDADENTYINLINQCSRVAMRLCRRRHFKYKTTTEYHDGKGVDVVTLNHWPVISITSLYDDSNRDYGSNSLIDTDDYEIMQNNNDNSGIVRIFDGVFADSKSNVKITYVAGWSDFTIFNGLHQIQFNEGASDLTASLTEGSYNGVTLAAALESALDDAGTNTYTVTYSETSHKFTIEADASFDILWSTGNSATTELGNILGFDTSADDEDAVTYTSDEPVLGLPEDLMLAVEQLVRFYYNQIKENRIGKTSEMRGEQSFSFDYSMIPMEIRQNILAYRAWRMY